MDFDMKRVRWLRTGMQMMRYSVLVNLAIYIAFCSYFVFWGETEIDYWFVAYFSVPFTVMAYREARIRFGKSLFLEKLNCKIKNEGAHARFPTATERHVVKSFFETKGIEMPFLLTCDYPKESNAYVIRFQKRDILLITEQMYRDFSVFEIWATIAHECGHLKNGDMVNCVIDRGVLYLSWWISVLALVKIILHPICILVKLLWSTIFLPVPFLHLASIYPFVFIAVCFFWWWGKFWCLNMLYLAKEILADNTATQILGETTFLLEALKKMHLFEGMTFFAEREKALLWIRKK